MSFDRGKRRRRKPTHAFYAGPHSNEEERLLQQAIKNSRLDRHRPNDGWLLVPYGPVFYPTVEEFEGNPLHYIDKIRPIAEKYGIAKIVPPSGWNPPFCVDMHSNKKFQTKEQHLHRLQEGVSFGDGEDYNPAEYIKVAREKAMEWRDMYYQHSGSNTQVDLESKGLNPDISGIPANNLTPSAEARTDSGKSSPSDDDSNSGRKEYSIDNLEKDYWNIVETQSQSVIVEYGNDVDAQAFGSGFPSSERGRCIESATIDVDKVDLPEPKFGTDDFYKETWWNLNNIPCAPDSILRHIKVGINGINVPWMYYGSLFSTFCWHNEDNYLYSINYHHWGAPKQWYGVPGNKKDAEGLEKVFKNYLSMKMRDVPDLLHHITTMFSPRLLQQGGVPVYKIVQNPGEFVVTFPRAFHGGFSYGPNVGEAVNFATHDWIHHGADANERYRSFARPAVFSHDRLTFTMANHLKEQKAYNTCRLLVAELQRVIDEEMRLRNKLLEAGVRDLSGEICLPANRLDQLDEESADYDDKRLCHACKHVCFFSCVACECSQSKVSCLRHSHYMCRCPPERKYMMIWSQEDEMSKTLEAAKTFCEKLNIDLTKNAHGLSAPQVHELLEIAPGVNEDLRRQKSKTLDLSSPSPPKYPLMAANSSSVRTNALIRPKGDATTITTQAAATDPGANEAKRQKLDEMATPKLSDVDTSDGDSSGIGETTMPIPAATAPATTTSTAPEAPKTVGGEEVSQAESSIQPMKTSPFAAPVSGEPAQ